MTPVVSTVVPPFPNAISCIKPVDLFANEFANAVAETPGKIVNFISNEVEKTKEYQKNSWAEMKTKWPWTMFKGKDNE